MAEHILDQVLTKLSLTDKKPSQSQETEINADDDKEQVSYVENENNYSDLTKFASDIKDFQPDELSELLDFATGKDLHQHVKILLEHGANPNIQQGAKGRKHKHPVLKAANQGFHQVLRVMKEDGKTDFSVIFEGETILHYCLRKKKTGQDKQSNCDYEACLNTILDKSNEKIKKDLKKVINKQDMDGHTALHYATDLWSQDIVQKLLEFGSHIGIKNKWQEIPISKIRPETMRDFLDSDSCLSFTNDVCQEDFALTFHYDFLAPDKSLLPKKLMVKDEESNVESERGLQEQAADLLNRRAREGVATEGNTVTKLALPETESLWYMGKSKEHRHLLKHPVITSFLWFKWKRMRKIVNRNLRVYILFVFLLTWYIFENFGGADLATSSTSSNLHTKSWYNVFIFVSALLCAFILRDFMIDINDIKTSQNSRRSPTVSCLLVYGFDFIYITFMIIILIASAISIDIEEKHPEEKNRKTSYVLKLSLISLLVFLSVREFIQMLVSIKRYITSAENLIEVLMIILVSVLLSHICQFEANRHLAAITIVLSWSELVICVGKHPKLNKLNIYVTMFFKVLKDFALFLLWYSMFIIAFGIGFYIMLHKIQDETNPHVQKEGANAILRCKNGTVLEVPTPTDIKHVLKCPDGTELEVKTEDEYEFFNKNWLSLVKTATMFTGELEFGDIPINRESYLAPLGYIFFLIFLLLVVVILMNLLTGLAVGEIGEIKTKAEIYSYLSQVETISYIESMMLGDPFDFLKNVPKILSWVDSCSCCRLLYRFDAIKNIFTNIGSGILLFYDYLPDKSVTISPNKSRGGCTGSTVLSTISCSSLSDDEMGRGIIASAKDIIVKRLREVEKDRIANRDDRVEKFERREEQERLINIEKKLEEMQKEKQELRQQLLEIRSLIISKC